MAEMACGIKLEEYISVIAKLRVLLRGANGYKVLAKLEDFTAQRATQILMAIPVFKTIKVGVNKSADQFRQIFVKSKIKTADLADRMLDCISYTQKETELDLVYFSTYDIIPGDMSNPKVRNVYDVALALGLKKCPADVGPQLRVDYQEKAGQGSTIIGMEPWPAGYKGGTQPNMHIAFSIYCIPPNDRVLSINPHMSPDCSVDAFTHFIFVKPHVA